VNGAEPLLLCVGEPTDAVAACLDLARYICVPLHLLKFVDRVPDSEVPYWIRVYDVVTIPWQWTEFSAYFISPLKLFEYMAAGASVVATDLPSSVRSCCMGKNGALVEPGNVMALADAICNLLEVT
jgi:glycosyltransferase involved in cell wall biosynthesis